MTLKIKERIEIDEIEKRQTEDFPALNIYPDSEWRYAVSGYERAEIMIHDITQNPFWDGYPLEVKLKARKLNNWDFVRIEQDNLHYEGHEGINGRQLECGATIINDKLVLTPKLPTIDFIEENIGEEEEITLVPYGCTTVRLTVFPCYCMRLLVGE